MRQPPLGWDYEDLYGDAILGLIRAIDRFDPTRNLKFETYAIPCIRHAIQESFRNADPLTRRQRTQLRSEPDQLQSERHRACPISLEIPIEETESETITLADVILDPNDLWEELTAREQRALLRAALRELPARERAILLLHYEQNWTIAQIAHQFRISESRVHQLRKRALETLRARLNPHSTTTTL